MLRLSCRRPCRLETGNGSALLYVLQGGPELQQAHARLAELEAEARLAAAQSAGSTALQSDASGWGGAAAARGASAALRQRAAQWAKGALAGAIARVMSGFVSWSASAKDGAEAGHLSGGLQACVLPLHVCFGIANHSTSALPFCRPEEAAQQGSAQHRRSAGCRARRAGAIFGGAGFRRRCSKSAGISERRFGGRKRPAAGAAGSAACGAEHQGCARGGRGRGSDASG